MQQKGLIYKQHNQKTVGHKTYPPGIKNLSIIVLFLQNAGVYIYVLQNDDTKLIF